jgi:hypothetical protein
VTVEGVYTNKAPGGGAMISGSVEGGFESDISCCSIN